MDYLMPEGATAALKAGELRTRVKRAGMLQFIVFRIKRVALGGSDYPELFSDRMIDLSELQRIADSVGLPVEAQNGRAFPSGKGAKDFLGVR